MLRDAVKSLKFLSQDVIRTFGRGFGREHIETELRKVLVSNFEIDYIGIVDNNGKIIYQFGKKEIEVFNISDYKRNIDEVLYKIIQRDGKKSFDILIPYTSPGQTRFIIQYIIHFPALERQIFNINLAFLASAIIAFSLILVFSYFFVRKITIPIEILKAKANSIKDGNYNIDIPNLEDEFRELGDLIRIMAERIKNKHEELMLRNKNLENALNEVLFLQRQVLNYEKMAALGKISAGMSHEIDNPLGIIIGHAELILDELPKDSSIRKDVEVIIKESLRIKRIIRSLLDFARSKESKIKEIKLSEFLKNLLENFSLQKIFKKIIIDFKPEDIYVLADEEKLHQVLVNVILNAVQAMPEGGELTVELMREDEKGVVKINDTGIGIPEELQNKVFDLFFSTKKDGTGIGLAISKSFIEEMGGEIQLSSKENKGTTVIIKLPLSKY
ncbi:MAG: ATP-binding protein [Proteobacteria bacterium]|nr:ATP-binding protein [Pseudomonadota bacterium]